MVSAYRVCVWKRGCDNLWLGSGGGWGVRGVKKILYIALLLYFESILILDSIVKSTQIKSKHHYLENFNSLRGRVLSCLVVLVSC